MTDFNIKGYIIESQRVYDVLKSHANLSEAALKKLDTNNDMKITEDELVELLEEDENEDNNTNSTADTEDDTVIQNYMKQLENYNDQIDKLEDKREKVYQKMQKGDAEEMASVIEECQSLTNQIQGIRNNIYKLLINMEDYEQKKAEQAAKLAETEAALAATESGSSTGAVSADDTSSATEDTKTEAQAASESSGSYKYSGSNQDFVNKFNSSSFKKGVFNGKGSLIASVAEKYGLDPNLLASIMALETGWGTSSAVKKYNNPGGMMDSKTNFMTLKKYNSLEEGVEAVARNLKNNYINQGLTTISAIGAKYCPVGAANDPNGTNSGWVPGVTSIYNGLTGAKINADTKLV